MNESKELKPVMLSLFKGYADKLPAEASLERVIGLIRSDEAVRLHTEKYRYLKSQNADREADREKSGTPCFSVAVRFDGGKQKADIAGWTGLCLADFDHLDPERLPDLRQRAMADKHTVSVYTTISGKGLRIIYRASMPEGEVEQLTKFHARLFDQGNSYYEELLGCQADRKCKNVTRLSGLAHDPMVYYNPEAAFFEVNHLKRIAAVIEKQVRRQGAVYEAGSHNDYIMRTGYLMNQYGVSERDAVKWAVKRFSDYDGDVAGIFSSCYKKTEEHATRKLGEGTEKTDAKWATVGELESFLSEVGNFRHNVVTGKTEMQTVRDGERFVELDDRCVNSLWRRICKELKPAKIQDLRQVLGSEFVTPFHPFVAYMESLPEWDGTDYIAQVGQMVQVVRNSDNDLDFVETFRKWMVAMVASLIDEEVVNHEILVLVGRQGCYKTTWLNRLLPPALQRYFCTKANNSRITKDDMLSLAEFALICLEEIEEMKPTELGQLKAMVTMKTVNERAAYGHYKEHRPHIASFCGTSNHVQFLTDTNANRRWLPFEVERIENPFDYDFPYEGMYAQALALWKSGFHYWFDNDEIGHINRHNRHFEVPNPEEELVMSYFRLPQRGEECTFATATFILTRINASLKRPLSLTKIGQVMKRLGFAKTTRGKQRGYLVVELAPSEMKKREVFEL